MEILLIVSSFYAQNAWRLIEPMYKLSKLKVTTRSSQYYTQFLLVQCKILISIVTFLNMLCLHPNAFHPIVGITENLKTIP